MLQIIVLVRESPLGGPQLMVQFKYDRLAEQGFLVGEVQVQTLTRNAGSARYLVHGGLAEAIPRKHPDGRVQEGILARIGRLTLDDIVQFHGISVDNLCSCCQFCRHRPLWPLGRVSDGPLTRAPTRASRTGCHID